MINIDAKERGINTNSDITLALASLFDEVRSLNGEKTITFDAGEYYIDTQKCVTKMLYITNSMGKDEWLKGEIPHKSQVVCDLSNINDLTIEGTGAKFIISGKATHMVCDNSANIVIKGLTFDVENPEMHDLTVINKGAFYIDYSIDKESKYIIENDNIYFVGNGQKLPINFRSKISYWTAYMSHTDSNSVKRSTHPLRTAVKFKEIAPYVVRAYYIIKPKFKIGDVNCLFDNKRKNAGFFFNNSAHIVFDGVTQHFNCGLAYVAQNCDSLTIQNCVFAPNEARGKQLASVADFIQICMCRGHFDIKNNTFIGAGDDCLNVHGIHYGVFDIKGNSFTARFMHRQSHGFNPLRVGDKVRFVDKQSLAFVGEEETILSSNMIDNYNIQIELDHTNGLSEACAIEDITACPSVDFTDNYINRIITRGVLITTKNAVNIARNNFVSCAMANIKVANDAKGWYESGRVESLTIQDNIFNTCPDYTVWVKPANGSHLVNVHKNITIKNNLIHSKKGGFYFKNAQNVVLENNKFTANKQSIENINSEIIVK